VLSQSPCKIPEGEAVGVVRLLLGPREDEQGAAGVGAIHYWIQVLEALGKGQIALGKAFDECGTR